MGVQGLLWSSPGLLQFNLLTLKHHSLSHMEQQMPCFSWPLSFAGPALASRMPCSLLSSCCHFHIFPLRPGSKSTSFVKSSLTSSSSQGGLIIPSVSENKHFSRDSVICFVMFHLRFCLAVSPQAY